MASRFVGCLFKSERKKCENKSSKRYYLVIYWVSVRAKAGLPAEALAKAGRSIPVVQVLWEHLDWVQFPAARHDFVCFTFYPGFNWDKRDRLSYSQAHCRGKTRLPDWRRV